MTELTVETVKEEKKAPAIWIPTSLALASWIGGILFAHGWDVGLAIYSISSNPLKSIEGLGGAFPLLLGVLHLIISQFFKSKRNPTTRRNIIIVYSGIAIAILVFVFFVGR